MSIDHYLDHALLMYLWEKYIVIYPHDIVYVVMYKLSIPSCYSTVLVSEHFFILFLVNENLNHFTEF